LAAKEIIFMKIYEKSYWTGYRFLKFKFKFPHLVWIVGTRNDKSANCGVKYISRSEERKVLSLSEINNNCL